MMKFQGTLYCIHGFLGLPSDWDAVIPKSIKSVKSDLFSPQMKEGSIKLNFNELSRWINIQVESLSQPRVLIGYSLGGRIALHALLNSPQYWSGAVIISAHPGLSNQSERDQRIQRDFAWAKRFEENDWNTVISDWNSQPVFKGSIREPERKPSSYSRQLIADSLRGCSLGVQSDLSNRLKEFTKPILWVVGERDTKFLTLAEDLKSNHSSIQVVVVPQSGHRVLFDQPELLSQILIQYLELL